MIAAVRRWWRSLRTVGWDEFIRARLGTPARVEPRTVVVRKFEDRGPE